MLICGIASSKTALELFQKLSIIIKGDGFIAPIKNKVR